MYIAMAIMFILGYAAIALEHPLKVNKAASALFTAVVCWVLLVIGKDTILTSGGDAAMHVIESDLMHHLGEIGGILFFLLGAMTIVEIIDAHDGFSIITKRIKTKSKRTLMISLCIITFFMSATLDNLTTSIVMATLLSKVLGHDKHLWLFAGMIIIAANAGGAWSPIGDVTTIMLWIGGNVTAGNIILKLIIPSMVCLAIPLAIVSSGLKGTFEMPTLIKSHQTQNTIPYAEKRLVLVIGVCALVFVPVFKTTTHLPPFLGILFGLSVLWVTTEILHRNKKKVIRDALSINRILERVDTPSILFFLGILLAVAALQSAGHLAQIAIFLNDYVGDIWIINILIGLLSAIVDNVPLVAGAMGMYDMSMYPQDHIFWELLAYCAGTGGSCLIIGSAAGVAIMGILHIDFIWYLKKISLLALAGYLGGALTFWLLEVAL